MAEHDPLHEDRRRLREERRADIRDAVKEELPKSLQEELPKALQEHLPKMMVAMLWGDMRPPRTWEQMRSHFEEELKATERRAQRGQAVSSTIRETLSGVVKDVLLHLIVSTGIIAAILHFILQTGKTP